MIKFEMNTRNISLIAVMSALTCIATLVFQVYIPDTQGYFNVGEVAVYTSALLFGPIIGGISGGLGSAIADLISGYSHYAIGTLIIKGIEGFIVGLIGLSIRKFSGNVLKLMAIIIALIASSTIYYIGATYYSGLMELSIGFPYLGYNTASIFIPSIIWIIPAIILFIFITYTAIKADYKSVGYSIASLIGGIEMVIGYFLYEFHVLSFGWAALAEVPFNICQMLVGTLITPIIVKSIIKAIPIQFGG